MPLIVRVPLDSQADLIETPGAQPSTHEPQLENDAFRSVRSEAAVV